MTRWYVLMHRSRRPTGGESNRYLVHRSMRAARRHAADEIEIDHQGQLMSPAMMKSERRHVREAKNTRGAPAVRVAPTKSGGGT